jgi:nucleoside phosphorylase
MSRMLTLSLVIRTFPKIRFGLMVGIGGGAPTAKHDIRLGDIIVATPNSLVNEVQQYDFGKTVQDQKFQRAEGINNCPPLLKNIVSAMKAKYLRKGHQLQEHIERALGANERMRHEFRKPHPSSDILYKSSFVHPVDGADCSRMCVSKPEYMLPRPIPPNLERELLEEMRKATEEKVGKPKNKAKKEDHNLFFPEGDSSKKNTSFAKRQTTAQLQQSWPMAAVPPSLTPGLPQPPFNSPVFVHQQEIPPTNGHQNYGILSPRDDPTIHYGPIASGNQLMKDAKLRDSLAHEVGVLCFEMEASGLMDHFPSLVVRGICDYADTRK